MTATYGFPYVIEAVSTRLVSQLSAASVTLSGGGILFGREMIPQEQAPPRVAVVPKGATFIGRDAAFSNATNVGAARLSRPIDARRASGEVHCWGVTYEQAEFLMDQFRVALQYVVPGQIQMSDASWTDDTNIQQYGQEIVFQFSVIIPIVDGPVLAAPSGTVVDHDGQLKLPSGSVIDNAC